MHLVIFESASWINFAPISLTRPICAIASGTATLLDRQLRMLRPRKMTLWVRPAMEAFCRDRIVPNLPVPAEVNTPLPDAPVVLLNAAAMRPRLPAPLTGQLLQRASHGEVSFTFLTSEGLSPRDVLENTDRWQELTAFTTHECQQAVAGQLADVIHENHALLAEDFAQTQERYGVLTQGPFQALAWESIRVGAGAKIAPGVVLDASHGPIILDAGASVGANSVIEGPCYIGTNSTVRPISLVRQGMTIGAGCKVGGEVAESIMQANSNKGHDGFLGHSFLGEWVNLGAMTTTSNLKNTYGPITLKVGSREVQTGRMFLGALVGDYTKTAIGTRLMSGSYVGVSSMIATSSHAPRFVGSFQFITDNKAEHYQFRKAVEVASRVFARRQRPWTGLDETMLLYAQEHCGQCEFAESAGAVP